MEQLKSPEFVEGIAFEQLKAPELVPDSKPPTTRARSKLTSVRRVSLRTTRVLLMCPPIHVASLAHRVSDLGRLVSEYLAEATLALGVGGMRIPERLHGGILWQTRTLADLEKVVTRIAVLKSTPSVSRAAWQLGMAPVSLMRWARPRRILALLNEVEWDGERDRRVDQQPAQNGDAHG